MRCRLARRDCIFTQNKDVSPGHNEMKPQTEILLDRNKIIISNHLFRKAVFNQFSGLSLASNLVSQKCSNIAFNINSLTKESTVN